MEDFVVCGLCQGLLREGVTQVAAVYGRSWGGHSPSRPVPSLPLPRSVPEPRGGAVGFLLCLYIRNK